MWPPSPMIRVKATRIFSRAIRMRRAGPQSRSTHRVSPISSNLHTRSTLESASTAEGPGDPTQASGPNERRMPKGRGADIQQLRGEVLQRAHSGSGKGHGLSLRLMTAQAPRPVMSASWSRLRRPVPGRALRSGPTEKGRIQRIEAMSAVGEPARWPDMAPIGR